MYFVFRCNTSQGTILLYISKCIVEVIIPLSFVISEYTLLILGNTKNPQFFLKKLYGGDADISACIVDVGGTA